MEKLSDFKKLIESDVTFEVGERVYSLHHRWGKILEIGCDEEYPCRVEFKGYKEVYTPKGFYNTADTHRTLLKEHEANKLGFYRPIEHLAIVKAMSSSEGGEDTTIVGVYNANRNQIYGHNADFYYQEIPQEIAEKYFPEMVELQKQLKK